MPNSLRSGAIYDAISKANDRRVFAHWHASSISECPRSHYLKRLGAKPINEPTAAKMLRWQAGHSIEEVIRPFIDKVYGQTTSNERLTSTELDLTGEYDNLTVKDHRLIEIKSVHDLAFYDKDGTTALKEDTGQKGPRGGTLWAAKQSPYLHHELQNHAYVLLLAEEGITVTNIDYVYVSLSGRLVVYSTKVQPELLEAVKRRLKVLNDAWATKTPPECLCKDYDSVLYDSVYKWCEFKRETTGECCVVE